MTFTAISIAGNLKVSQAINTSEQQSIFHFLCDVLNGKTKVLSNFDGRREIQNLSQARCSVKAALNHNY
jgi:hypothetical protein